MFWGAKFLQLPKEYGPIIQYNLYLACECHSSYMMPSKHQGMCYVHEIKVFKKFPGNLKPLFNAVKLIENYITDIHKRLLKGLAVNNIL